MCSAANVRYQVTHSTRYEYAAEVLQARHWLHLRPRDLEHQVVHSQGLIVDPAPVETHTVLDAFGNNTLQLVIERPHASLEVIAEMQVELKSRAPIAVDQVHDWQRVRDELGYSSAPRSHEALAALCYRFESPQVRIKNVFSEFATSCFGEGESLLSGAINLMHKLFENLTYKPGATHTHISLMEVLEKRHGVCQDYAHLMIACMRSLGLSARYVSGYLRTAPLESATTSETASTKLIGADASHAWVAVYAPPFGWVDLDPTNDLVVNTDHITLAWGRDFSDVSPLRGVLTGGGDHKLVVGVSVVPLAIDKAVSAGTNAS
jgi:transglutaminase-like putative cysteine protease